MQQADVSAYTHLAQFAGDAKLSTWLTRIAMNEAFARTRQRAHRAEVDLGAEGEELDMRASNSSNPEELASGREQTTLLEHAVDGLPELYRVVFMMREVQQLSTAETAACLELSEDAVKVRLHRAKTMLREEMAARMESAAPDAFGFLGARCDRIVARVLERIAKL